MFRIVRRLAVLVCCGALAATATVAVSSRADVLVNAVTARTCSGSTFQVGVWYQAWSGGANSYQVEVYDPSNRLRFFRRGKAPSANWAFWRVKPDKLGTWRSNYYGPGFNDHETTLVSPCR